MKINWLAIAISAAVPAIAAAQQDGKDNGNQNQNQPAQIRGEKSDVDKARAEQDIANAKRAIEAEAYDRALIKVREQRQIKAAWLGLSASPAPAALRKQLKLPDGTGLVVDFIQPDSPAAKAGLKQYDLLTKLSDQILINSEQLSVLVRTFKSGSKVHVEFLREGEHQSVDAQLVEHEVPPLADEIGGPSMFQFTPQTEGFRIHEDGRTSNSTAKTERTPKNRTEERRTLTLVDGKNRLSVEVTDGHRILSVLDNNSGKLVQKYPIDSDAQIHAVPDDVRAPLGKILSLMGSGTTSSIDGKQAPDGAKANPDARPENKVPAL